MGLYVPLGLDGLFPFPCWGKFQLYLFKTFLIYFLFFFLRKFLKRLEFKIFPYPFFFSSSPGTPIIRMLVFLILSQRSLRLPSVLFILFTLFGASLVAQRLKHLPPMRETWVWSLGQEDPLEKGMATHCSILAWRNPWTEEPGWLESMVLQRVGPNWATNSFTPHPSAFLVWNAWLNQIVNLVSINSLQLNL